MAYIHHSHTKCQDCGEKHRPGNSEECIELLKGVVADADEWRQRAEAAEAKFEKQREVSIGLAGDLCAARLDAEARGRAIIACTDTIEDMNKDRDRLSREVADWHQVADSRSAEIIRLMRELEEERDSVRCLRNTIADFQDGIDTAEARLAVAVKALESIAAESYNDSAQDKARRALEAISNKEQA